MAGNACQAIQQRRVDEVDCAQKARQCATKALQRQTNKKWTLVWKELRKSVKSWARQVEQNGHHWGREISM